MSIKIDIAETKAAEYLLRFAAVVKEDGQDFRTQKIMQMTVRNFHDKNFREAVQICAGTHFKCEECGEFLVMERDSRSDTCKMCKEKQPKRDRSQCKLPLCYDRVYDGGYCVKHTSEA